MADWTAKQHDRGLSVEVDLEDDPLDDGNWIPAPGLDLAESLTWIMRSKTGGPTGTGVTVTGQCEFVAAGRVRYTFDSDDLMYDGDYDCEIEVTDSPAVTRTYPGGDPAQYFAGKVVADLNAGPVG